MSYAVVVLAVGWSSKPDTMQGVQLFIFLSCTWRLGASLKRKLRHVQWIVRLLVLLDDYPVVECLTFAVRSCGLHIHIRIGLFGTHTFPTGESNFGLCEGMGRI